MNKIVIIILSIVVPILIGTLFFVVDTTMDALWVHSLPLVNAIINGLNALVLVVAVVFVKKGNEKTHQNFMKLAFMLGFLFMVSYVTYHASVPSTKFGDVNGNGVLESMELQEIGYMRVVYLGLLLSHILMAVIALPLILTSFAYGLKGERVKHKKIVRFTFPVWLYVSITGVLVYILISPYY